MKPLSTPASGCYVFDRFRLSADGTLLVRDGSVVPLAPKVLQTLLVLVRRPGEVVRKEDLLRAVWPDSFVEDTGLTRNISLLRGALGDEDQLLIATVARVGYRFTAPVEHVDGTWAAVDGVRAGRAASNGGAPTLVVGRETELMRLERAFAGVRGGHGGIVAITGEPGIGKTTLVEAFLNGLTGAVRVARGRCSERLSGAEPHLPLLEALAEITGDEPTLTASLGRLAPTWSLQLAPADDRSLAAPPSSRTGGPERLMRELTTFFEDAARTEPLLVVIEDIHWADVATVDVLAHLAPRLVDMRLLVIVTYRERDMLLSRHPFTRIRGDLIARGHLDEVPVSLLRLEDVREYLKLALADVPSPIETAALVFERTEGNPLFMVEMVRFLRKREGSPSPSHTPVGSIPDSLQGLIDKMLQELEPATHLLLSIAAVQGYEFDSATLASVSGTSASEVEQRLRNADRIHGLVRLSHEDERAADALSLVYRFAHVLYQDALVGELPPSRRVEWARQIAEALMASHAGGTDTIAGSLALLLETGRDFWKASKFFFITSRHATRLFAYASASELAQRGLQCLKLAAPVDERERSRRELDLTLARLVPLASIHGYASAEAEHLTSRVVSLAEELGDVAARAAALSATWPVRMVRGECIAARNAGVRLVTLAGDVGDNVLLINGHMNAQIACHHMGHFDEAREYAAKVMALADQVPHPDRCINVLDPVVASLAESARNCWITGDLVGSLAECERAVATGEAVRHPDSLAFAWVFHAWIHGYRGDWTTCLVSVENGIRIASEAGSVQTLAWNRCVRGWARAHVGDTETGRLELEEAIETSKAIMGRVALPQFNAMMAEVFLLDGEVPAAEERLKHAAAFEDSHDDRNFAAEVHRLAAVCRARRGRIDEACSMFREAMKVARAQGAATFELRAALNLTEYDSRAGRRAVRAALARIPKPAPWPEIDSAEKILRRTA